MNIAINGFGRIGRSVFKLCLERKIPVVAINDLADAKSIAESLKYDSVYGKFKGDISSGPGFIKVNGKKVKILSEKNPENLPWTELKVSIVIESTGKFTTKDEVYKHLRAGAKKVIITAPAKNPDITLVPGVNTKDLKKQHEIISLASCTTNALTPVIKVIDEEFGIKKAFMTTVHAYTSTQNLQDSFNKNIRKGRAGAQNIIPSTTGANEALTEAYPKIKGKIQGISLRVPVIDGSIVDFVAEINKETTKEKVNKALRNASQTKLKGILEYTKDEIVSSDIIGNPHSGIIDSLLTDTNGNLIKVMIWYDNEYGYSNRVVDTIELLKKM